MALWLTATNAANYTIRSDGTFTVFNTPGIGPMYFYLQNGSSGSAQFDTTGWVLNTGSYQGNGSGITNVLATTLWEYQTNAWALNTAPGTGSNLVLVSSTTQTIGIPSIQRSPASTEREGRLMIIATSGTCTVTNALNIWTSDTKTNRVVGAGTNLLMVYSILPAAQGTNVEIFTFSHP
jgi:hypothetical protein